VSYEMTVAEAVVRNRLLDLVGKLYVGLILLLILYLIKTGVELIRERRILREVSKKSIYNPPSTPTLPGDVCNDDTSLN